MSQSSKQLQRTPESAPQCETSQGTDSLDISNTEQLEALATGVRGPLGRLFNRILGFPEESTETADMGFNETQLCDYIENQLDFAEGEWFRTKKVNGVAAKLMEELDQDQDCLVNWSEFQASVERLKAVMGVESDTATAEELAATSGSAYDSLGLGEDASLGELQDSVAQALPEETAHLDLVAQFAARLAIDLADTDQREETVDGRQISRDEWVQAAVDLSSG